MLRLASECDTLVALCCLDLNFPSILANCIMVWM